MDDFEWIDVQAKPGGMERGMDPACRHLRHLFPYLPVQSGYNKRLRRASELLRATIRMIACDTALWSDDVWVMDSTPVECGRSRQAAKRSALAGWATYGYCASHSRWFWGCGCTWSAPCTACRSWWR